MTPIRLCAVLSLCSVVGAAPALAGMPVEDLKDRTAISANSDPGHAANAAGEAASASSSPGSDLGTADRESVFALGVDISGAGSTPEAEAAFFKQLPAFQQANIRTRCVAMVADQTGASAPPVKSFCEAVLGSK